jgi:hypothetical protein
MVWQHECGQRIASAARERQRIEPHTRKTDTEGGTDTPEQLLKP